jgi:kynurenine formamidase
MSNSQSGANAPHISLSQFEEIFHQLKTWNDYSETELERGALNHISAEVTVAAAQLVQSGEVVSMALPWNTVAGPDNHKPSLHYMVEQTDGDDGEPTTNKDFIATDFHGKAVSHFDAFAHIIFKDQMFGGKKSSEQVNSRGSAWGSVDKLGGIATRGVLLDAALLVDKNWIEPGTAVHKSDVLSMEDKFGFKLQAGDVVLLRSGHFARRDALGVWDPSDFSAGFHFDVMELFRERKISVIGADGDSDVRPSPVAGLHSPVHALAITAMGIPLLDNLQLEPLAAAAKRHNRWSFFTSILPLNIPRGTGSPVNPIAIF